MSAAPLGCGHPGHNADCLCDVVTNGEVVPVRFGLRGVKFAEMIARATGKDADALTRSEAADFMIDLANGYEAVQRTKGRGMHRVVGFTEKRTRIATYLREGGHLVEIPVALGIEWDDVINILTRAQPSRLWVWPIEQWKRFEKDVRAAVRPNRELARSYDLNISTIDRFWKLFHGPPI